MISGMTVRAGAGALLRHTDPVELDAIEHVYRTGSVDLSIGSIVGRGANGPRSRHVVEGADGRRFDVVSKPAEAGAAAETDTWKVARQLGIAHLFPITAQRPDGTALIELLRGSTLEVAGIRSVPALDRALAHAVLKSGVTSDAAAAAKTARVERELLGVLEFVRADPDRPANSIVDARRGPMYLDFERAGWGARHPKASELAPGVRGIHDIDATGTVTPSAATIDHLRARVSSNDMPTAGDAARLQYLLDTGSYRITMLDGSARDAPLQVVDEPNPVRGVHAARFAHGRGGGGFGMM